MTSKEKIKELLEASLDGTITAEQVTAAGLHRSTLHEFVENVFLQIVTVHIKAFFCSALIQRFICICISIC